MEPSAIYQISIRIKPRGHIGNVKAYCFNSTSSSNSQNKMVEMFLEYFHRNFEILKIKIYRLDLAWILLQNVKKHQNKELPPFIYKTVKEALTVFRSFLDKIVIFRSKSSSRSTRAKSESQSKKFKNSMILLELLEDLLLC